MRNIAGIIIPGRLESSRCPNKLLKEFDGKPLIQHAYEGASKSRNAYIKTLALEDDELVEACKKFANPMLVRKVNGDFKNGTERSASLSRDDLLGKCDIICVVQGDELLVDPELIDALISEVASFDCDIATAVIKRDKEHGGKDPSKVKAQLEGDYLKLLDREDSEEDFFEHIGIYAYRKAALWKLAGNNPSKNERLHNVELNRALDLGFKVKVVKTEKEVLNVNTQEDVVRAIKYFEPVSNNKQSKSKSSAKPKSKGKPKKRRAKRVTES